MARSEVVILRCANCIVIGIEEKPDVPSAIFQRCTPVLAVCLLAFALIMGWSLAALLDPRSPQAAQPPGLPRHSPEASSGVRELPVVSVAPGTLPKRERLRPAKAGSKADSGRAADDEDRIGVPEVVIRHYPPKPQRSTLPRVDAGLPPPRRISDQ